MTDQINKYYKAVCEAYSAGNTETLYNTPIITLFEQFGCTARDTSGARSGVAGENIDIKLWRSDENITETEPFAGVEVKKVDGIDERARGQIKTEAKRYGNAILTDNLVWQFWRSGEDKMYSGVQLIEKDSSNKLILRKDNIELFISLVKDFLLQNPANIRSSSKLAEYMAMHARTIRDIIAGILKKDSTGQPVVDDRQQKLPMFPELFVLFERIKKDLRPQLDTGGFADMYAQTIVYGLFIARYNDTTPETFDKYEAIGNLEKESKLLEEFFAHIARSGRKHPTLEGVIDKLCDLYRICNISELLGNDGSKDAIIHFYEEFLTFYDPALRKSLGVFYTPAPAVRYLVSMVDRILTEDFGISGGLSNNEQTTVTVPSEHYIASPYGSRGKKKERDTKEISVPRVAILDPATGTGSFLAEIIRYVKETYFSGGREAFYKDYIQNENGLLSRLIGFEIMMTSYVVAHLKLRRTINETLGAAPDTTLPTNIFLTNTLAPPQTGLERNAQMSLLDFSAAISDEAYHADTWKTRRPIKVIIGNPPYLAASTNPYDISAYKTETDGVTKINAKNLMNLNDDYVKFFRFAQEIISRNNEGILAFVSNNGYLDNQTFRGMRASLLRTFKKIYIINLHGSAQKQETAPDGSKDENIFEIMQGVSLFIGVKNTSNCDWAKVYYADLWGIRESKFQQLQNENIRFTEITPDEEMAYFIPYGGDVKEIYETGVSVSQLFPITVVGIESGRDNTCIQNTYDAIKRVLTDFQTKSGDELRNEYRLGIDTQGWTVSNAINDVQTNEGRIIQIAYRPFDKRWTYYTGISKGFHRRPRGKQMRYLLQSPNSPIGTNIGFVFPKGTNKFWDGSFISDTLIDAHYIDYPGRSYSYIAPLYLYDEITNTWSPNFDADSLSRLTGNMSFKPEPIEVFDYIYGILYDPVYRERFNEFLKRDFPRVPIINAPADSGDCGSEAATTDAFHVSEEMFKAYVSAGERLRKLHLMQEKAPAQLAIEPNDSDNMEISAVKYKDGVLHINGNKRITGIPQDVWEYRIGGYQVLDKWLKSHKGDTLTIESFDHICNVTGLLAETIKVQQALRELHDTVRRKRHLRESVKSY